ncbi:MAG: transglutaminase-like cysteine peptidase [Hyphomicrobiales bacterium]|nr:transglutaminase-like cysteine peptidase [Hyphomicrobiales bacterium]
MSKRPAKRSVFAVLLRRALLGLGLVAGLAATSPIWAGVDGATYEPVGAATSVPYGWVDFCQRYKGECTARAAAPADIVLTARTMREIQRINAWVNKNIEAVSDMDHWGVVDQWDYPTDGKGDCEDYALLKRRMLMERGFPMSALLMTVVKDKNGDGHAILTVKTDRGDFVLDNLSEDVKGWNKTGYRFVKRQSQNDQNAWVSIGEPTAAPAYVSR